MGGVDQNSKQGDTHYNRLGPTVPCRNHVLSPHPMFLQKSTEHMKKVPTIILSITYKGVKFIDASNKVRCSWEFCVRENNLTGSGGPVRAHLPPCDEARHQCRRRHMAGVGCSLHGAQQAVGKAGATLTS